ncbi:type I secretion system permease/ATPase [Salmonella enterica]|nr:type I secretion system permease/ATPase [Salmonella enterica]EIO9955910.1 type I secretion system permease/ATPase [Salmonella enterica]EIV5116118.1 type I secretion system permease/ATPase [Salmonella enterica]
MSVHWICHYFGKPKSIAALVQGIPKGAWLSATQTLNVLENAGFSAGLIEKDVDSIDPILFPVVLLRQLHGGMVLLGRKNDYSNSENEEYIYSVILPELSNVPVEISSGKLNEIYSGFVILTKPKAQSDKRSDRDHPVKEDHWLFSTLLRYRRYFYSAALAAIIINILALAGTFFTMNVYDRVVPNQAYVTLWSLAAGVALAMLFEFMARNIRAWLLDVAGKKTDLVIGSKLFFQVMTIRMEYKPSSAGSFANQLREFESVRDFITSATLATLSDIPFIFLFVGMIFLVAGPLGLIPLLVIPIIVIVSVAIQWPLAKTMQENLHESSLKQGLIIEAIEGLETLKSSQGEGFMQKKWETFSALAAASAMKSRRLSTLAINFVSTMQQLQTVSMVCWGVYLIEDGVITLGGLIGSVILSGRAVAPLAQVAGLAVRYQQAKAALSSLTRIMAIPVDKRHDIDYLADPVIDGNITLKQVEFSYPSTNGMPQPLILKNINIEIKKGEKIAILGRVGSGKSTLLKILARLYLPVKGQLFSDGLDLMQIDPADWRKAVGYVGQDCRLFYGTLKQNVMIGRPEATLAEFLRVMKLVGLDVFAAQHPLGYNLHIGEMGNGLSGGQKQLVALARCLIRHPKMVLFDEPTSAMDNQTEAMFIKHLKGAIRDETIIIVTHRPSLLPLVDRILVVEQGEIISDGPREVILTQLRSNLSKSVSKETKSRINIQPVAKK